MRNTKIKISPAQLHRPNSNINVVPLVDVVLVLLMLFMVLTPLLEKDIAVQLPEDSLTTDEMPEGPLVVSLDKTGHLYLNQETVADGDYVHTLRRVLSTRNNRAERVVFFSVDGQAGYEKVVFALDGARQAGAASLGLLTTPLDNAPMPSKAKQE